MKVLVTGANGYLGLGVVRELLDNGFEVVATDFSTDKVDNRATCVDCNVFEIENPYEYFYKPDILLHMAWRDGFVHYSESHISDLPNHYAFLKKIIESDFKSIAVMGSMHEIGFHEGSINEDTICNPLSLYGVGKDALRKLFFMLGKNKDINCFWLRGYYIVGNTDYGCSIFSKIVAAEKEGKEEFPFTMGQNQFDFIDYDVFCKQVVEVLKQDKITGIINICSGKPEKLAERVERFILENKFNIKLKYGAFPDRPYDSKAIWGDDNKIREIIENNKTEEN